MFYETSQIDKSLECPICNIKFEVPKLLSCGESVCEHCIQDLLKSNGGNEFMCPVCGEMHDMPRNRQFTDNRFLMKILKEQPNKMEQSKVVKQLKVN